MATSEERRAKNREAVKRWKAAHPEKVKEHHRTYYQKHRDRRLQYFRDRHILIMDKARKYDEILGGGAEE